MLQPTSRTQFISIQFITPAVKNVGYLVFNSFLGDTAQIYSGFERVFNRFQAAGVNEVVIDLTV